MSEKPEIDLNKFRQHKRTIPWGLIRKIIIGGAVIGMMYYFINQMEKAKEIKDQNLHEIEVEVED